MVAIHFPSLVSLHLEQLGWLDVVHGGQGGEEGIQGHDDGLVELYTKLPLFELD